MLKKTICAVGICILFLGAAAGVFVSANMFLRGNDSATDTGYYLIRENAAKTYRVKLPAHTAVSDPFNLSSDSLETVELTYQYSNPGKVTNWDVYTDKNNNQYTYQETTGRLVSILYLGNRSDSETVKAQNKTAYKKDDIIKFSDGYLQELIPAFSKYTVADYQELKTDGTVDVAYPYTVKYGVPIGDYFFADQIILRFSGAGELIDASFPMDDPAELSEEEQTRLVEKLPSYETFCKMAQTAMKEQHPEMAKAEIDSAPVLSKTVSGYTLCASVSLTYAAGKPYEYTELEAFSYDVSMA